MTEQVRQDALKLVEKVEKLTGLKLGKHYAKGGISGVTIKLSDLPALVEVLQRKQSSLE